VADLDQERPIHDVAILGAGAAGLVAAIRAAERGARVVLVEKNRRPGVKILMSGGTRCNITNARGLRRLDVVSGPIDPAYDRAQCRGVRAIQQAFGTGGAFLGPALKAFDVDRTVRLFEDERVATKIEGNGKVFPVSDRATDVLDALVRRLERSGAELRCLSPAIGVRRLESGFAIEFSDDEALQAKRLILAMGGQSFPGCGTTGDGYAIARELGHTIVPTRPALVPLRVEGEWVAGLKGLTLPDVVASVREASSGRLLQERREAVLFAHFGLTGPAILDVSRAAARLDEAGSLELRLDLVPDVSRDALDQRIQTASRRGRRPIATLLPDSLPRRLADCLRDRAGVPADRVGPELSRDERKRLLDALKQLALPLSGSLGFEKAEVTRGGVSLDEVDPHTLESRIGPGLHFAGEVLDLDGLIGGYNFQAAWSTGWLAGEVAARSS
jgi:predicted Rossmann fold flavoprotein